MQKRNSFFEITCYFITVSLFHERIYYTIYEFLIHSFNILAEILKSQTIECCKIQFTLLEFFFHFVSVFYLI